MRAVVDAVAGVTGGGHVVWEQSSSVLYKMKIIR